MPIDKGRVHNNDKPEKHDEYAGEQTGNGWRIVPNKDTGRRELRHEQTIRFSNISKDVVKRVAYERFGIAEDSWLKMPTA